MTDETDLFDEADEADEAAADEAADEAVDDAVEPGTPSLSGYALDPDAIVNAPLSRARKGYAVEEVDDLLDQLAAQTGDLMRELGDARDELVRVKSQLVEVSETESTLKRTLVTAQRAAEHSIEDARAQAELIRERSTERAQALLARAADQAHELREAALCRARADETEARRRRRDLEEHIERLRSFADDHQTRLRHHLDLQLERLGSLELPEAPPVPEVITDPLLADGLDAAVDVEAELAAVEASVNDATAGSVHLDPTHPDGVRPQPAVEIPVAATTDVAAAEPLADVPDESLYDV